MNEEYIKDWLSRNRPQLSGEDADHLAMMLHHLYLWFTEDYPVGDFLQAYIANNLEEAVVRADEVNVANLIVYIWFTKNKFPYNWREIKQQQRMVKK